MKLTFSVPVLLFVALSTMGCGSLNSPKIQTVPSPIAQEKVIWQDVYGVYIDTSLTYPQLIAAGNYDKVAPEVNQGFIWLTGNRGYLEGIIPLEMGRSATTTEVLQRMDALGLRPADLRELLFFGATFPDFQRKYTVVALGQSIETDGLGCVPCLDLTEEGRVLRTFPMSRTWDPDAAFAAVRK